MKTAIANALQLYQLGAYETVLTEYGILAQDQDCPQTLLVILAQCHLKLGNTLRAARHFRRAGETKGQNHLSYLILAGSLFLRGSAVGEAYAVAELVRDLAPDEPKALELYYRTLGQTCLFDEIERERQILLKQLQSGDQLARMADNPLDNITWCDSEEINASLLPTAIATPVTATMQEKRRNRPHVWGEQIRIGYLSDDFYDQHPVMHLFQGALCSHDERRFEVTLLCHTSDENIARDSGTRKKYPNIVRIGHLDDEAAAKVIAARNLDILVDLKGHTAGARFNLINQGLAPIQVSYLGFPGLALGLDCDYVISDRIVTPDTSKPFYSEKLCRLPGSYQANDNIFRAHPEPRTRASLGLPEDKFVFAFFNATRKLTPETFRLTTEILRRVENSVLWILFFNRFARDNFMAAIAESDIDTDRIILASATQYAEHLSRLAAADLGLDTFPYNGHTTTSDALWAGLPVITKKGNHFASRVSESLLTHVGLPDLVTQDEQHYVDHAVALANDPTLLGEVRKRLETNRANCSLFDTKRFVAHLERGYEMMVEHAKAGLLPDHIDVPAL